MVERIAVDTDALRQIAFKFREISRILNSIEIPYSRTVINPAEPLPKLKMCGVNVTNISVDICIYKYRGALKIYEDMTHNLVAACTQAADIFQDTEKRLVDNALQDQLALVAAMEAQSQTDETPINALIWLLDILSGLIAPGSILSDEDAEMLQAILDEFGKELFGEWYSLFSPLAFYLLTNSSFGDLSLYETMGALSEGATQVLMAVITKNAAFMAGAGTAVGALVCNWEKVIAGEMAMDSAFFNAMGQGLTELGGIALLTAIGLGGPAGLIAAVTYAAINVGVSQLSGKTLNEWGGILVEKTYEEIKELVGDAYNAVSGVTNWAFDIIGDGASRTVDTIVKGAEKVADVIGDGFQTAADCFSKGVGTVTDFLGSFSFSF